MGIRDHPTAPRSPWQNGQAERLIGSIAGNASITSSSSAKLICAGSCGLRRLLQRRSNTSRGQGRTDPSSCPAVRRDRRATDPRRPSSSILPDLVFGRDNRLADNDLREGKVRMNTISLLSNLLRSTNEGVEVVQVRQPVLLPRTAADELPPYREQPWNIDRRGYRKIDPCMTLFPWAGYRVTRRGRCLPPLTSVPVGCGSIRRSIEVVFRRRERTLQFLACADLHPSDYASAGSAGPLAANEPMVLVGSLGFSLPGHRRSLAVGAGRSAVASGSSQPTPHGTPRQCRQPRPNHPGRLGIAVRADL